MSTVELLSHQDTSSSGGLNQGVHDVTHGDLSDYLEFIQDGRMSFYNPYTENPTALNKQLNTQIYNLYERCTSIENSMPTGGIAIEDVIGNSPIADGVLFADGSGSLRNSSNLTFSNDTLTIDSLTIATPTVHSLVIGNTGFSGSGAYNTVGGYQALHSQTGTGGSNTIYGARALWSATNTANSTAFGAKAGYSFRGTNGLFFGQNAGHNVTTGSQGTYVGIGTGFNSTTAIGQTYIGQSAGYYARGGQNVAIGNFAIRGTSGSTGYFTVGIGAYSFYRLTSGIGNVGAGTYSGYHNQNGGYNLNLGYRTGYWNVSGSYNVKLGRESGFHSTGSRCVFLGDRSGYNETGSNKLYICNSTTATPLIWGDFATGQIKLHSGSSVKIEMNSTGVAFNGATPIGKKTFSGGTDTEVINEIIEWFTESGFGIDDR